MSGALGWLRARLGVRVVTSLAAALSVAVVLLLAGAALVLLTDRILRDTVQETALQQATVVAQRVEANFEDDVEKNADDATAKRGDLVQVVRDYDPDGALRHRRHRRVEPPVVGGPDVLAHARAGRRSRSTAASG